MPNNRLFFGAEVEAPWPNMPKSGRLIDPKHRHLTLAFLGQIPTDPLINLLKSFSVQNLQVGIVGKFSKMVFFHHHVACYEVELFEKERKFADFREHLCQWLLEHDFTIDKKKFHPHVTMARGNFDPMEWEEKFQQLPMMIRAIHLYESLGNSRYHPLWSHSMIPPFEEIEHTADIAFRVSGMTADEVHLHAQVALCFPFPEILPYIEKEKHCDNLDDIVIQLNELVTKVDQEIGCPFKAVSFHGEVKQNDKGIYEWEMIVDV